MAGRAERVRERVAALAGSGAEVATFAERLVVELRSWVPHAAACVVTVDPATGLLTGSYKFGGLAGAHETDIHWVRLEYGTDDPTRMAVIAVQDTPAMATSHLPGGADDSIRMRELVGPAGYSDELRMVARDGEGPWGGVNLFRAADDPSFTTDEVRLLADLSETVADGLRAGMLVRCATDPASMRTAGPAVLVVADDGTVRSATVGAKDLLGDLTAEDHRSPAESVVHGLVTAARRYAAGEAQVLPRARLRSPTGGWLIAQVAPLASDSGPDGEVVITIDEARPPEIVSILASAFGLTAREREVTQLVLRGTDTKGIARELSMSTYTVQDHLKSIFDKAAVRSRRELMAKVFFDQYAPRLAGEVAPSGWFRDGIGASAPPQPAVGSTLPGAAPA